MMMFICYFFPGLIGIKVLEAVRHEKLDWKDSIIYYALFVLLINGFIALVMTLILGAGNIYLTPYMFNYAQTTKYIGLALILAIFIPIIYEFITKNIKINIEIKKKDVKNAKKK